MSIFNLTGLLLGTFTGAIADAIGHRRLMLTGLGLQIAGCFLGSFSNSFNGLLATRFLEGAGFLAVIISTPTLIFQVVHPKDMKVALSIWSCYLPAGASLMMILLPFILTGTDWRGLWQINAVILIAYTFLLAKKTSHIQFMNPSSNRPRIDKLVKDIIRTSTCAGPLLLALIFFTYALQWLAVMGFLPTLIIEKYGFSKGLASLLTAFMVFINIFGNLAGGRLLKRGIKRWKLIAFASCIMGASSIAIYSAESFILNYAGCLIFSVFGGLIPASILSAVPVYAPSKNLIATTNGLVIQGGQTGQVMGPPLLAFLVSQTGSWSCGSWFLGSVALIGVVLSLCLSRLKPIISS